MSSSPATPSLANMQPTVTKMPAPDPDRNIRIAHSREYPQRVWFAVACLIALVSICHWTGVFLKRIRKHSRSSTPKRGVISYRRLPQAILNSFRAIAFRSTISYGSYSVNLTEVALALGYTAAIFTVTLMNTTSTKGVKFDPKYWANLAGILAAEQFPLLVALGSRNNVIAFLTGISYEKLNCLHRTVARVVCVLIWLHGAGRIKLGLTGGLSINHPWVRLGLVAASALTLLVILSVRPMRKRHFEVFIVSHTILALLVLLAAFFHVRGIGIGAEKYVWPCLVVWGFDRFLRLLRLVLFNAHCYLSSKSSTSDSHALVEVLSPRFLRVTIKVPEYFRWSPGQSAFLNVPSVSKWRCEFHPFTISSVSSSLQTSAASSTTDVSTSSAKSVSTEVEGAPTGTIIRQLRFYIRVHGGFTARLRDSAQARDRMRVVVDGPYSAPPSLQGYGSVVLIAGGTGVAFTLPLFLEAINHAREYPNSACQRLVFIWANPESKSVEWISSELSTALKGIPDNLDVSIRVYISGNNKENGGQVDGTNENSIQLSPTLSLEKPSFLQVEGGRPDVVAILTEELKLANDSMSVNVCGPNAMSSAARSVLRSPRFLDILKGGPSVNLHVEGFGA